MNPNSIPKRLSSWVYYCLAAIFIASTAFGQGAPSTQAGGAITINDAANASPYPSTVLVTNYVGAITRVTVTLNGVTHGYPDDIDAVLEAPNGERVSLWSDAGGQNDVNGVDVTLDSSSPAAPLLPDEGQITTGRFRPTNNNPAGDVDPAISAGAGTDLGVFVNDAPNGLWRLFVSDDTEVDAGSLRGWTLRVFTEPLITITNNTPTTTEDTATNIVVTVNDSDTTGENLAFTAFIPDASTNLIQTATFSGTGTNRTLTIQPRANQTGTATIEVRVTDEVVTRTSTVTVTVTAVNDAPSIALNTPTTQVAQGGISTNILATVGDIDNDPAVLTLSATSSNPAVVAASNVFFVGTGTNTTRFVRISPTANAASGTATVTITVRDPSGSTTSANIDVTVTPVTYVVAGNPAAITIPTNGTASPYPSTVTVANVSGLVGNVTVTLLDFNHAQPNDVGILLVGPGGQEVVLMRGAGGATALSDQRLVFDDAAGDVPAGTLTTSTNGPADYTGGNFPTPAPTGPYSVDLSAFNGTNPNGVWSLYVYDADDNTSGGAINGGFAVNIFPAPVVGAIGPRTTQEDVPIDVSFSVSDQDGTVTNIIALVTDQYPAIVTLTTNLSGNTGTVRITPLANQSGTNIIRVIAQDNNGFRGTNDFSVVVTPVNDLPTQSVIPKQLARAGQSVGPISFTVGDVETPPGNLEVRFSSNNPKLLPPGSIILGGSGSTRTITIFPASAQGGQADITVTVVDENGGATAQTFDLTVEEAAFPLFENVNPIQINDNATASPYPSVISVAGLSSPISEVQVTLFGITHPKPDDLDIMLVHPSGALANVVFMSDAGGSGALNNVTLIFRDSATSALPDNGQIVSGTYDPSNYGADDFPRGSSPDDGPQSSFDAAFDGLAANGDWRLFVVDDEGDVRGGVITSWQLGIRTRPVIADIPDQTTTEDTQLRFTVDIGDSQPGVDYTITTNIVIPTGNVDVIDTFTIERSGDSLTITIVPLADVSGTNFITLTVTDPDGFSDSEDFSFIVTPRNDAPRFSDIPNTNTPAATPITLAFTVVDVEGSTVTLTATSSDTAVVPAGNISLGGSGVNRTITIVPEGITSGQTTITITGNDGAGGVATETFTLNVTRNVSFANTRPIIINDFAPANPYPSTIDVAGVLGSVSDISVVLSGFSHEFPDDVDVLLVSPDNREVMLMSDAGGSGSVTGLRLAFADDAPLIPDNGPLSNGLFEPRNYTDGSEGDEAALPSPAPAGPYDDDLSTLAGVNPNGQWRLYVRDDTFGLFGQITGGWILIIETGPTITQIGAQTTQEDVPAVIPFTVSDQDTAGSNLVVTASFSGNSVTDLLVASNLVVTGTGNDRVLTITPTANLSGTNLITLSVRDENNTTAATSFPFRVNAVDDPSTIAVSTNLFGTNEDSPISIPVTIGDIDSTVGQTNVTVTSSNTALVPNSTNNIALTGETNDDGDDQAVLGVTITPAANQNGSTVLTISVRDATTTVSTNITLNVTNRNDAPFIATSTNRIVVPASATSGIVNVQITDIETPARNLTLTAETRSPSLIPNSNILLGGSDTNRTLQVIALSTAGTATIDLIVSDGSASTTNAITVEITPAPGSVFSNPGVITIRDNNTATPYPSTIVATGLRGPVSRISVTLDGLTHTAPDDVDVLLVHRPSGRRSLLLSDVGGANAISNVRLTFDARGGNRNLADDSPIVSGTYLPTDFEGNDVFPSSAPAGAHTANLANFNGVSGNGEWDLFVLDDAANNSGQIAFGWSLRIETAPTIALTSPPASNPVTVADEDNSVTVDFTIDDMNTTNGLALSFSNSNPGLISRITQTPNPITGPNISLTVTPVANASGTNVLTITVSRPDSDANLPDASTSVTVTNIFNPINDLPTLSRLVAQTTQEDVPVSFEVLIGDVDNALTNLWLLGESSNDTVISDTNILINASTNLQKGFTDSLVRVTLRPNAGQVGTSTITLTLSEAGSNPVSSNFLFTVTERNDRPTIVNTNATVAIAAGESANITFQASDPEGLVTTVTATSADQTLVRNADIVVAPAASASANRTATITTRPGVQGRTTITFVAADPSGLTTTNTFTVDVRPTRERVFSNNSQIVINDNAPASPYPSVINVSGLVGNVAKVTVTLNRFYHTFPDDVDMLLVSPTGQRVVIWSDMGGGDPDPTNVVIKLDDAALNPLPNSGPLVSGTFRPTADEPGTDNFTAPAPAGPYAETLANFNGQNPNGDWRLFIIDDTASDSGLLVEGWSLGITTQPILLGLANVTSQEDVPARVSFTIAEESFASTDFTFTATSSNPAVVPSSTNNIVFSGTGTNRTVTVIPAANASGASTITVTLRNVDGQQVNGSFVATFTPVNDSPTITSVPNQTVTVGSQVTVTNFNFADVETEKKDLVLSITSSNPAVVAASDVVVVGNDLTIISRGSAVGRSTITITVTDEGGVASSIAFEVLVTGAANPVFANTQGIVIRDNTTALPYPSTITVSNVAGTVTKVTVTLTELRHSYPDDVDILLVGPNGTNVVLMSDAGAGGTNTPAQLVNGRLTFDDAAPGALPDNSEIPEFGTFRPSNYEGNETFTAPAPAGPYGVTLGVFNGTVPNGTWSLYVMDDASPDAGSIGTWLLSIQTTAPSISEIPDTTLQEDVPVTIPFTINAASVPVSNLVVNAEVTSGTPIVTLTVGGTGTDRTLTLTPRSNQIGTNEITVSVTDGTNTASTTFTAVVRNVDNDPPVIAVIADQTTPAGTNLVLTLPVTDSDTPLSELTFFAATAGTNIVSDIQFDVTSSNTVVLTVTPIAGASGTEAITISVSDGESIARRTFNLEVESDNRRPVITPIADVQTNEDVNVTVPVVVTDAETPLAQLVITGESSNTNLVTSVTVANNGTQALATVNLAANQSGIADITIRVSDGTNTVSDTFRVTVTPVADRPSFAAIADQTAQAGTTTLRVPLTISDADTALADLTLSGSTSGTNVQSIAFERVGNSITAVLGLSTNGVGTERVTISVSDGDSIVRQSFDLTIGGVEGVAATLTVVREANNLRITVQGTPGATYLIEGTPDFRSWTTLASVTIPQAGTAQVLIPATSRFQFFRARTGAAPVQAQAAVYEGFAYPAGTQISTNENGGTGWTGAWTPDAESPTGHTVSSNSLQYVDAGGRGLVTAGGSVFYTATNQPSGDVRSFRDFAAPRTNGTTWVSFIAQRMGPTVTNTGTPNNLYPRAANISFYQDGTERFAIGNGSGAVSNFWSILPAGSVANVTNEQRSATPMNQQAFIVLRIDHIGDAAAANDNAYMWINPSLGSTPDVSTASARSVGAFNYSFNRIRPFVGAVDTANNRPYAELNLDEVRVGDTFASVTPHRSDLSQPFNAIQLVNGTNDTDTAAGAPPANEGVVRVIDGVGQKYLNFLDLNSGFTVTMLGNTVVNGLRFWPANDAPERDPASYKLEGSTAGPDGPFTLISEGPLSLSTARNAGGTSTALSGGNVQVVDFSNTTPYTSYRVTFPTLRDAATANSLQIAEVDFLGSF